MIENVRKRARQRARLMQADLDGLGRGAALSEAGFPRAGAREAVARYVCGLKQPQLCHRVRRLC